MTMGPIRMSSIMRIDQLKIFSSKQNMKLLGNLDNMSREHLLNQLNSNDSDRNFGKKIGYFFIEEFYERELLYYSIEILLLRGQFYIKV